MPNENDHFLAAWENEAQLTIQLLRALPKNSYEYRPDKEGRSLGEMAWHLAELEAYMTFGIEKGEVGPGLKPPGIERPLTIEELAAGYERIHREAVERVRKLRPEDYPRMIPFFDGSQVRVHDILWGSVLHHLIHHRGQLTLLCRMAGGTTPRIYGPSREDTMAMRHAAS